MNEPDPRLDPDVLAYYAKGIEAPRLSGASLERIRTEEILLRVLPAPPATVVDVGGGPGVYARFLARNGYAVHLVDPVPLHVAQAAASTGAEALASARQGDARRLESEAASADAVLLLGPLYHLVERADRLRALREARRVLKPGGRLVAAVISRFASALDGLRRGISNDPDFAPIVAGDLRDGIHRNPTGKLEYFTTSFFHAPEEARREAAEAGFDEVELVSVEGPAWLFDEAGTERRLADPEKREALLAGIRSIEREKALAGASAHLLIVARRG